MMLFAGLNRQRGVARPIPQNQGGSAIYRAYAVRIPH
jgi:hypothetical protein